MTLTTVASESAADLVSIFRLARGPDPHVPNDVTSPHDLSSLSRQTCGGDVMSGHWQLQEAKQRFSELIRLVETEGPQFVTRHGEEVAVVMDVAEYRRLRGGSDNFKEFLRSGPDFDALEIVRAREPAPVIDLDEPR